MSRSKYKSLFERLVANTQLSIEGDAGSCWLWTGKHVRGYGRLNVWRDGKLTSIKAHRAMLEEFHDITFPFDEAGHYVCHQTLCINPLHLEVQTKAHNLADRRGMGFSCKGASWIPVLFPRGGEALQAAADRAWDAAGTPGQDCPF